MKVVEEVRLLQGTYVDLEIVCVVLVVVAEELESTSHWEREQMQELENILH